MTPPANGTKWRNIEHGFNITITNYFNHGEIDMVCFKASKKLMGDAREMGMHQPDFRKEYTPIDTIPTQTIN